MLKTEGSMSPEEEFRQHLDDVVLIIERLAPLCQSWDEMIGMVRHATGGDGAPGNDAQLRLLMKMVKAKLK
jgi:hypothetical protein